MFYAVHTGDNLLIAGYGLGVSICNMLILIVIGSLNSGYAV